MTLPHALHRTSLRPFLMSPAARPLRFIGTGGTAGAAQLGLLLLLTHHGWDSLPANALAFLLAAQLNFGLSLTVTWRDRVTGDGLLRRWFLFHTSIASMALVNALVFLVTKSLVPPLLASMTGIAAGAVGNYLAGDHFVFRASPFFPHSHPKRRSVA